MEALHCTFKKHMTDSLEVCKDVSKSLTHGGMSPVHQGYSPAHKEKMMGRQQQHLCRLRENADVIFNSTRKWCQTREVGMHQQKQSFLRLVNKKLTDLQRFFWRRQRHDAPTGITTYTWNAWCERVCLHTCTIMMSWCHLLQRVVGCLCSVDRERELLERSADSGLSTAAGVVCPLCSRCLPLYFSLV